MSACDGCNHTTFIESEELKFAADLTTPFDADDPFARDPNEIEVNSINPGQAGAFSEGYYGPWKGYTCSLGPGGSCAEVGGDDRYLTWELANFFVTGWNGSCQPDSTANPDDGDKPCIELDSCNIRLHLRFRIEVSKLYELNDRGEPLVHPELPLMPEVRLESTVPTVSGETVRTTLEIISGEEPQSLPPDESGTLVQQNGNPLPTVVNSPGASVGSEILPAENDLPAFVKMYRDYYVEAVYRSTPGCGVHQSFDIDLSEWVFRVDGLPNWGDPTPIEPTESIDFSATCFPCAPAIVPPDEEEEEPGQGPSSGKNHNPASIEPALPPGPPSSPPF